LATCSDPKFRDPRRAVKAAKKALESAPKRGDYWKTLAWAQYRAGDWKAAVAAMEKVKELGSPGDSIEWFLLAMAHWQLGNKDKARQWYDKAVACMERNKPKDGELRRFRAEAAELLGVTKEMWDGFANRPA
jgi:Flp pilus assembly protein TadD